MPTGVVKHIKQSGGLWFQGLFVLAAVICATASFIALARSSPTAAIPQEVQILLVLNTVVLLILGWIVAAQYLNLKDASADGGGRLAQRFMLLFGAVAIIPTLVVSLFLWATITKGIDTWFGDRVVALVEDTAAITRDNLAEFTDRFEDTAKVMAVDVSDAADGYFNDMELFEDYLNIQSLFRDVPAAYLIDRNGVPTAVASNLTDTKYYRKPSPETYDELDSGEAVVLIYEQAGFAVALMQLENIPDTYLYLAKPMDAISRLRRAEAGVVEYRLAEQRSEQLQSLFIVAYFQIVALILLLSVRLAQEVAGRISGPISRLAYAARDVSEGERGVQVPLPDSDDEVRALSKSFNVMTTQLDDRRRELVTAREDAETRQQFLATLLADLSAGVIRIDQAGVITIANRSAESLLGRHDLAGQSLIDIAPELSRIARQTIDTGEAVEASLNLEDKEGARHIRLKVTKDADAGYVLTFDDATRLVTAQRQLAWRDVAKRIAHEIRNPLTPILLSTERLRRRYSGKIADEDGVFERCLDTISRQVTDIGRMVQEFSDFARMPKPTLVVFELSKLLEETCFAQSVVSPDLKIEVVNDTGPIEVVGDERLLGQAFGNIIKNAAEALSARPEGEEAVGHIMVRICRLNDGQVEITVQDNGPGFPQDVKDQLLEPYVTAKEGGTGLGLAIVNRVIMDHGGTINLQNRPDGQPGAFVRVVLPVEIASQESLSAETVEYAE